MFPFHEDKVKSDEYGEIINYEDFMDIRNTHSIMSYKKKIGAGSNRRQIQTEIKYFLEDVDT